MFLTEDKITDWVDSWDDITLPLLQSSYRNIQKRQMENGYCMEKITLQYWIERFEQVSNYIRIIPGGYV